MRSFRPLAAACSATLSGVGLQRFAYAPLLPAMVAAGWLGAGDAGLLGAANLTGYLVGALLAGMIARALGMRTTLRLAMATVAACFALCAWRGGLWWFLPWRVLTGLAGGALMGLAGPAVQAVVPPERRAMAGGVTFTGVGLGIMVGAAIVPALLPWGLPATWLALAAAAGALAVWTWRFWPDVAAPPRAPAGARMAPGARAMVVTYALSAAAAAAQMVWWPDFLVRGLGHSSGFGGAMWLLYGAAAAFGPTLFARAAGRIGAQPAFVLALLAQGVAALMPLAWTAPAGLVAASMLAGASSIGCTAMALLRAKEIAGDGAPKLWRLSSACWGAAQASAVYALTWLYGATGSHRPLFAASAGCAFAAAALALRTARADARAPAVIGSPP